MVALVGFGATTFVAITESSAPLAASSDDENRGQASRQQMILDAFAFLRSDES